MIFKMINMKQKCDLTTVQLSRIATSIKIQICCAHITPNAVPTAMVDEIVVPYGPGTGT